MNAGIPEPGPPNQDSRACLRHAFRHTLTDIRIPTCRAELPAEDKSSAGQKPAAEHEASLPLPIRFAGLVEHRHDNVSSSVNGPGWSQPGPDCIESHPDFGNGLG